MTRYTLTQFHNACITLLGYNTFTAYAFLNNHVSRLCTQVAESMLLGELLSQDPEALQIVKVTAENLWRKDGDHRLKES